MPDSFLFMPSPTWDAQPSKKRRISVDELERDFLKLTLSGDAWKNVQLDTLLQTLTLNPSPVRSAFNCGPSAPREGDSCCSKEGRCTNAPEIVSVTEDCAITSGVECTAIVPFNKPARQRRWRRIPRVTPIPRCLSVGAPAKFVVDAEGTAFVLHDSVRSELCKTRDTWKRSCAEEQRKVTSTAIVIYQKPRKHDLVEDFMTLSL